MKTVTDSELSALAREMLIGTMLAGFDYSESGHQFRVHHPRSRIHGEPARPSPVFEFCCEVKLITDEDSQSWLVMDAPAGAAGYMMRFATYHVWLYYHAHTITDVEVVGCNLHLHFGAYARFHRRGRRHAGCLLARR